MDTSIDIFIELVFFLLFSFLIFPFQYTSPVKIVGNAMHFSITLHSRKTTCTRLDIRNEAEYFHYTPTIQNEVHKMY